MTNANGAQAAPRAAAWKRFNKRAMLILYPIGALLMLSVFVVGPIALVVLLAITIAWNAYFFLIWRPRFNERYPIGESNP